ncbi:TetR/AcrR family transcriptional regulator [Shewanella sp. MEBiC00475]|uniref:TetR/AcrR family transcriptional regulator n=1 Tax=Shewanella sp. MEBiC00475 TaxID=2575361 RepID=UPI0010BFE996|nr:TetR/AcrR family transcriptional regulator [Shewanella sp. MEBiC00475]
MAAGRKKEFDEAAVLDSAMKVFWQKGYVGTSMSDLTESMGIKKQSLYNAFINKEQLFIKATDLYLNNRDANNFSLLYQENISLSERMRNCMMSILIRQCDSIEHKGCFVTLCQSDLDSDNMPAEATQKLIDSDNDILNMWVDLFLTDPESIALGLNKRANECSMCIFTTLKGTACMSRINTPSTDLTCVIENCLKNIGLH